MFGGEGLFAGGLGGKGGADGVGEGGDGPEGQHSGDEVLAFEEDRGAHGGHGFRGGGAFGHGGGGDAQAQEFGEQDAQDADGGDAFLIGERERAVGAGGVAGEGGSIASPIEVSPPSARAAETSASVRRGSWPA